MTKLEYRASCLLLFLSFAYSATCYWAGNLPEATYYLGLSCLIRINMMRKRRLEL